MSVLDGTLLCIAVVTWGMYTFVGMIAWWTAVLLEKDNMDWDTLAVYIMLMPVTLVMWLPIQIAYETRKGEKNV